MKERKLIIFLFESLFILVVSILAFTIFANEYLFSWCTHNKIFSIIIIAIPFIILALGYSIISLSTILGIVLGLFTGNFLGNIIMNYNISKIVQSMSAEQVSRLHHHPGFEIWMSLIVLSFVIGVIINCVTKKINS